MQLPLSRNLNKLFKINALHTTFGHFYNNTNEVGNYISRFWYVVLYVLIGGNTDSFKCLQYFYIQQLKRSINKQVESQMKNIILAIASLVFVVCSYECHATDEWIESSVNWAKSVVPEQLTVSVNKTKTSFEGYRQQKIELLAVQNIKNNFTLETEIHMNRARAEGIVGHKETDISASIMPRYQVNQYLNVGVGIKYEPAPIVELPGNGRQSLGSARSLVVSGKIKGLSKDQWLQIDVANYKRDSFDVAGAYAANINGFTENTVSLNYKGRF